MTSEAAPAPEVRSGRPDRRFPAAPGWAATLLAATAFLLVLYGHAGDREPSLDLPWAPTIGARLSLALDGFAVLYGLVAAGVGVLVFAYATAYLPAHHRHEHVPPGERGRQDGRFWGWMALFLGAMVGLATAQDLLLLFVFFDLTAVASFFLIAHDAGAARARKAATTSLVLTAGSAVGMLVAVALLYQEYGTLDIATLGTRVQDSVGPAATVAGGLVLVAALVKSAQVPAHIWLPRAMAAPTPVSAYLHSAAMVAAGVLVIGRMYPVVSASPGLLVVLVAVGATAIAVGGVLSLAATQLKAVLAYSTVSQYGYVVVLYGIGGEYGAVGAAFYVLAHALAKSALFMTAGAVTEATGASDLRHVRGLARRMPVLAVASGLAAANLAALPLTVGFFKDELFFAAALEAGGAAPVLAAAGAALTLAYIGRFWLGVFTGEQLGDVRPLPRRLVWPVVVPAVLAVVAGVVVEPVTRLAEAAGSVSLGGAPADVATSYHIDLRPENLMALAAWAGGALVLLTRHRWAPLTAAVRRLGDAAGPARVYDGALDAAAALAAAVHKLEVRDLRSSIAAVLVPGAALTLVPVLLRPDLVGLRVGRLDLEGVVLTGVCALIGAAAVLVARLRQHLALALALSLLGYGLAAVYALMGAPAVALVAVVVETMVTVVLVAALSRLPAGENRTVVRTTSLDVHRLRDAAIGVLAGGSAFVLALSVLSRQPPDAPVSEALVTLSPQAHADNVVTGILVDFRGLDTLGEITVLATAAIGVAALLRAGRLW